MLQAENPLRDCWYVVHTRSRHEKIVRDELTKKSIENYLPVFHQWHQWKDRRKRIEQPVFSGYVFARFCDNPKARTDVLHTPGAARILGDSNGIAPVPDSEVEAVRRILSTDNNCVPHPFLKEGAWVRVRRGPLKGIEGLLIQVKNGGRLVVSVNLLSQSVATEVNLSDTEVVRSRRERLQMEEGLSSRTKHNGRNGRLS